MQESSKDIFCKQIGNTCMNTECEKVMLFDRMMAYENKGIELTEDNFKDLSKNCDNIIPVTPQ